MGRQQSQRYTSSGFADELSELLGSAKRCLAELKADLRASSAPLAPRAAQEPWQPSPSETGAGQLELEVERLRLLAVSHDGCILSGTEQQPHARSGTASVSNDQTAGLQFDTQDSQRSPAFTGARLWEACGAAVDVSNDCMSSADQAAATSSAAWQHKTAAAAGQHSNAADAHSRTIVPGSPVTFSSMLHGGAKVPLTAAAAAAAAAGTMPEANHLDTSVCDHDLPYHCVQQASNWEAVYVGHVHPPQVLRVHVSPHDNDPISCAEVYEGCAQGAVHATWTSPISVSPVSSPGLSHSELSCSSEDLQTSSMSLVDDLLRDLRQTIHNGVLWHQQAGQP